MSGVLLVEYCNAFYMVDHNLLSEIRGGCLYTEPGLDARLDNFRFRAIFTSFKSQTIKRRVFVAITAGKLELGLGLGQGLGLGLALVVGLGGYELG